MQINLVFGANKANEAFKNPFQKKENKGLKVIIRNILYRTNVLILL